MAPKRTDESPLSDSTPYLTGDILSHIQAMATQEIAYHLNLRTMSLRTDLARIVAEYNCAMSSNTRRPGVSVRN